MVEKNQLTIAMLHNVANLQRQINSGHQLTEAEGSRKNSHKKNEKINPRKKGFKPSHLLKQQRYPSQAVTSTFRSKIRRFFPTARGFFLLTVPKIRKIKFFFEMVGIHVA